MSSSRPCCAGASLPVAREPLEPREATLASLICGRLPGVRLNEHLSHPGERGTAASIGGGLRRACGLHVDSKGVVHELSIGSHARN